MFMGGMLTLFHSADCTPPFAVDIFTDDMTDIPDEATPNTLKSRGLYIIYA